MKTVIAALALVLVAASPTLAAHSHNKQLYEGRGAAYVPQSSGYYGGSDYSPSSREQMIHNTN
jgi:hypothetical protein